MPRYFVNRNVQSNDEHEVHTENCPFVPRPENRVPLGRFAGCQEALEVARKYYSQLDGCAICSPTCHKH